MAACAGLFPRSVSVWAGSAKVCCFFGELIAMGMKERGGVGALVDGGSATSARAFGRQSTRSTWSRSCAPSRTTAIIAS
jgi:hypothetical protein